MRLRQRTLSAAGPVAPVAPSSRVRATGAMGWETARVEYDPTQSGSRPAVFYQAERFEQTLARSLLKHASPTGRFWDWPGDTEIVIAEQQ